MKLLSDFDGVWTHPRLEGRAQGELLDAALLDLLPPERREAGAQWLREARRTVLAEPHRYGWAPGGRISAFADEDPFAEHSALLHLIAQRADADALAGEFARGVVSRHELSLEDFGGRSHREAVSRVEETRGPGILPEAAQAGHRLIAGGVDIVLVSNSGGDKLARWFTHAGMANAPHPTTPPDGLRLRGHAGKFILDESRADLLELGALTIDVARPRYEAVLREEAPDAVVGDVFSIDLALPLVLKRREPSWRHVRLFWLTHDYAPERMMREIAEHAGGEVEMVSDGLPGVARALLGH